MRARGDQGQGVAERRPGRPRRAGITALGGLDDGDQAADSDDASWSSCPARSRRRRSQPRTVAAGTPSCTPSRAVPVPCSTDAAAARAITLTASARRGTAQEGSRTCVAPHDRHCPRRGRTRRLAPAPVRIARSRPQPQARSRPSRHEGQASAPDARSVDAASGSAHSSIGAVLPSHGTTFPGGRHVLPGAVRVAGCQAGRRPATGSQVIGGNDTVSGRQQEPAGSGQHRDPPCSRCRRARNEIHAARSWPQCSC